MFSTTTIFRQWIKGLVVLTIVGLSFSMDAFSQAEERTDPGNQVTNDINDNVYRNGRLSLGGQAPTGLPPDTKLHVNGRFSQEFSGNIGAFSSNDKWASLGESFAPSPGFTNIYGLFSQWGGTGLVTGVKDGNTGLLAWSGNSSLDFDWIDANLVSQTRMTILSNGRVGIGITPTTRLDVRGPETILARFYSSATSSRNAGVNIRGSRNNCNGCDIAYVNLSVFDSDEAGGSEYQLARISGGTDVASGKFGNLKFYTNNGGTLTQRMIIKANGNVGIGTTNPGIYRLNVNGETHCTLGFWSSSDKRFKKDIQKLEDALSKLQAIDGMSYAFKKQKFGEIDFTDSKDRVEYGFLAQDVEKVFPELVRKDEAGYYAVNYDGFIPVLVEALKEQQTTVETQAATIERQNTVINNQAKEIEDLKTRMDRLENLLSDLANKEEANDNVISNSTAVLQQNAPNPFSDRTTISYELPSNVRNASLVVYDLNGKEMQNFAITGKGNITIDASGLEDGTYIYAIVSNGQTLARQKMIVQK